MTKKEEHRVCPSIDPANAKGPFSYSTHPIDRSVYPVILGFTFHLVSDQLSDRGRRVRKHRARAESRRVDLSGESGRAGHEEDT
jgi:hypothetical protein